MKKTLSVLLFLFAVLVTLASAQEAHVVAVNTEKEVAIENGDVAAARTVALQLAARDAVEKAFGVYVKIDEQPNARQVIAQTASSLQYHILAEQQRGNRYWVKIEARVSVPAEFIGVNAPHEGLGDQMKNFVQNYPQGQINWGNGLIIAHGQGKMTSSDPNAEETAARAAEVEAKARMLEMINDIALDYRGTIGENKRISFAVEGFVKDAEVVARSKSGTIVNVTLQAPLDGVKGLTASLFGEYTVEPPPQESQPQVPENKPQTKSPGKPPKKPPQNQPEQPPAAPQTNNQAKADSFTGIVLDARKAQASPAVFPQIQDNNHQPVYTAASVNQEDLQKRGMASYAVVSREASISRLFPNAKVVAVAYSPETATLKAPPRQGSHPLIVKTVATNGVIKSNFVVSQQDAQKITEADRETGALRECRVVIVLSGEPQ
ncbi:MAG TPA: hypothetical protein VFG11_09490 [Acidobacteriota bacterium]|nr:hypothetical protein [Acidobacteriota bacterium]